MSSQISIYHMKKRNKWPRAVINVVTMLWWNPEKCSFSSQTNDLNENCIIIIANQFWVCYPHKSFTPTHETYEGAPQHVFQTLSEHLQQENGTKQID